MSQKDPEEYKRFIQNQYQESQEEENSKGVSNKVGGNSQNNGNSQFEGMSSSGKN